MKRARGFTLLEVLVALAILALTLAAATRAGQASLTTHEALRLRQLATWAAANRLAEERAWARWPLPGEANGEISLGGEALRWQSTVQGTPNAQFRRIDIRIFAAQDERVALAQLTALLTRPQ